MINLRLPDINTDPEAWQELLKSWCVAHQVTEDPQLNEPEIWEGQKKISGRVAINQFLEEYKSFMDDWYDCRCDKWKDFPADS